MPREALLEKTNFFFSRSHHLEIPSGLGTVACVYFLSQCWDLIWLRLHGSRACSHSVWDFMCASVLQYLEDLLSSVCSIYLLLQSLLLFFHKVPWAPRVERFDGHIPLRTKRPQVCHWERYPAVGLSFCSHLLQPEASLMLAEQDTVLWVEQNVIRSHFVCIFL